MIDQLSEHTDTIQGASVLRFADIEILRYHVDGFEALPLERKLLIYHLSEATLSGRDIIWDQHSAYGLRVRHILETVLTHGQDYWQGIGWNEFETYIYKVWFSSGLHHHYGSDKFVPEFERSQLEKVINALQKEQCLLLEYDATELADILDEVFDPRRSPKRTEQSGEGDLIEASSVNFYAHGIKQTEVEAFYKAQAEGLNGETRLSPPSLGLNSRLGRTDDGKLFEQPYHIGGLYGEALARITTHLQAALAYSDTEAQRLALMALIEYYKTGDLEQYNRFCILWVQDTEVTVDFINGFTETYTDPLGLKGSWEGLVHIRNHRASERTERICAHAEWFERHAPIDERFKKAKPTGVSATVVTVAMLGGDSYPATPIGINLPNADWIRAQHGSKSVTIDNIHEAYRIASQHSGMDEVFIPNTEVRAMLKHYEGVTEELHTDLHECLGHGSGQLLPGVSGEALGPYASTIEEARADLFALYYMADDKLIELGLLPDNQAYKACYYRYILAGAITQLVRIRPGAQLEEAHMRNRALIARYALERGQEEGTLELKGLELNIHDYQALRGYFADLLGEIQRIKSEGDIVKAKALVEQYAIEINRTLHTEILERYAKLNVAPYRGFVNPRLCLVWDKEGGIIDVAVDYTEGYAEQMLRYSREYGTLPLVPTSEQALRQPLPTSDTEALAKELRTGLRTAMDGVVSSLMRNNGLHYGINFGLTLEHVQRKASTLPQSEDLARYLLSRDVRELRLIGQIIYPAERLDFAKATYLSSTSFANPELRDCLCKYLFDRVPSAKQWALAWLFAPEIYADLAPIAYIILARAFTLGYQLEIPAQRARLYSLAMSTLDAHELEHITPLHTMALLMLRRWLKTDEVIASELTNDERLTAWEQSKKPILSEFASTLRFELEFY